MNFKRFITIYDYGYAMVASFKMIAFTMWDFGGLLVCYLWYQVLPKSVEKTFCIINLKIYNHLQAMTAILDTILENK